MDKNKKLILVIGAAGYIGSVLVRKLLAQGYRVRGLDCFMYDNAFSLAGLESDNRFEIIEGDFCDDAVLSVALEGVTDLVLLASVVGDPLCKKYPDLARRINVDGTINLIKQLNGRGLDRFLFMSTCSNYGLRDSEVEATEASALNPASLYAETKVEVEQYLIENQSRLDFAFTILRSATAYGLSPRMRLDLTVNEFTFELASGRALEIYDAETWRPYCHTSDIASALIGVLEAPNEQVAGEIFNLGSPGENYTKQMLADLLLQKLAEAQIKFREGKVDPRNYRVNFDKISKKIGFDPNYAVTAFMDELIKAVRQGEFDNHLRQAERFGNYSIRRLFD